RGAISSTAFRPTPVHPTVVPVRGDSRRSGRGLCGIPLRPSVLPAGLLRSGGGLQRTNELQPAGELYGAERDGFVCRRSHAERRAISDRAVRVARRWGIT